MKPSLLFLEDDVALSTAVSYLLRADYRVTVESTTMAAVRRLRSTEPTDVVVADITVPDGSPADLRAALDGLGRNVPVIWVSGHDRDEVRRRLGREPEHFLMKPYRVDELERRIADALRFAGRRGEGR